MMGTASRSYWLEQMLRVSEPVLRSAADKRLKQTMPIEAKSDRSAYTHLEAIARTLAGIAPWLELRDTGGEEAALQAKFGDLARRSIDAATDPDSADYCSFAADGPFTQSLVDAAFLSHAIIRAPEALWFRLDDRTRKNVHKALLATRSIRPPFNNWLLFSAMIEAALCRMGAEFDQVRIDYAVRQHEQWYKGDGIYGDGPDFHWDYYNSYVIQPMLIDIVKTAGAMYIEDRYRFADLYRRILARARRYADIQEKLISPEGTFPVIGRSLAYRTGAFQHLAQMALIQELPEGLAPGQVRCALQAVIERCLAGEANYDGEGWLKIGLCGSQPGLGEAYISTGSLYLCTTVFLPLGLAPDADFWKQADKAWSSRRLWAGEDMSADQAIE